MWGSRERMTRRGQVVLMAAAVVAAALGVLALAYLQLGYPADAAADRAAPRDLADDRRYLERAVRRAAANATGAEWSNRSLAVKHANDTLLPAFAALERRGVATGATYAVESNATAARQVAERRCPRGPARRFGDCLAVGGLVIQERAGLVTVLAAAVDIRRSAPRRQTNATLVAWPHAVRTATVAR